LFAALAATTPSAAVIPIGVYDNVYSADGEHAHGYHLELWKRGGELYGLLADYVADIADPPTGALEHIEYDPKSGKLRFEVRLSTGVVYNRSHDGEPSHDRLHFRGVLKPNRVVGTIEQHDELDDNGAVGAQHVVLPRDKRKLERYPTLEAWSKMANEILAERGPKWN
jgi:hypothetical protein